jgi:hypothetical protein
LTIKHLALLLLIGSLFGLTAGAALADGPPLVIPVEYQVDVVNPCTGELTTLSGSGEMRVHQFYNEAGDVHHFNVDLIADLETTDGFSGSEVLVNVHNAEGPFAPTGEEERGMQVRIDRYLLTNPETGQVAWARFTLHLTYVGGEFVVNTDSVEIEGHGSPA